MITSTRPDTRDGYENTSQLQQETQLQLRTQTPAMVYGRSYSNLPYLLVEPQVGGG